MGVTFWGMHWLKLFKPLVHDTAPLSSNLDGGLIGKYSTEPDLMGYGYRGGEVGRFELFPGESESVAGAPNMSCGSPEF